MLREGRLFTEGYGKMKSKAVSGIMLTLLLIGILTLTFNIQPVKAEPTTILEIPPITPEPVKGKKFNITINVIDVTNLHHFGITLVWNPDICEYTGTQGGPPVPTVDKIWLGTVFAGENHSNILVERINNTKGIIVGIGCTILGPSGVTGSFSLLIIEFYAKELGSTNLNFSDTPTITGMMNTSAQLIPHDRVVAEIKVVAPPPLPVGGIATPINIPLNKPEKLALWIWLSTITLPLIATAVCVKLKKKKQ
jgi:hypothetical protein